MEKWRFELSGFGVVKGFNDSGITMFRANPLKSLAREICQNSLDASTGGKVTVEFSLFDIPTENIPGKEELKIAFQKSIEFWSPQNSTKTVDFFRNAINLIEKDTCSVLRISDYNTTGLKGSRQLMHTEWTNLIKASGASDKKESAGGSYGIGKYAPFACSEFQTVFYSTYDVNEEKASQGVARLVSFFEGEDWTQGTGYYGCERNMPMYNEMHFEENYMRQPGNYGTDIYVMAYKYNNVDWQRDIIVAVLDGFLVSLWNNMIEVKVGDTLISKDTLEDVINAYRPHLIGNTDYFYEVLKSDKTIWVKTDIIPEGEVELGVLLGVDKAINKISMVRKTGMKIKNQDRFQIQAPFVGVMLIKGEKINAQLRNIENPEHTKWEPERANNPLKAKALISKIMDFIKSTLHELISSGNDEEVDALGVGTYIPDIGNEEHQEVQETINNKIADIEIKKISSNTKKAQKAKSIDPTCDDYDNFEGGAEPGTDGEGYVHTRERSKTPSPKDPQNVKINLKGDKKVESKVLITDVKQLLICTDKSKGQYVFSLTAKETYEDCILNIYQSAETGKYPAPLISVVQPGKNVILEGNTIKNISLEKGVPARFLLTLDFYEDYCALEVELYAIKK